MIINDNPRLFFYDLLKRAQKHTSCAIDEETESYLVFMLEDVVYGDRFEEKPLFEILQEAIEPENYTGFKRLGDNSLITLGLFRERISRRNISADYFRKMGQLGYSRAGELSGGHVFLSIAESFETVEQVLQKAKRLAPISAV